MQIHEFINNKSRGFAYEPIIASGKNACVLHYTQNNQKLKDKIYQLHKEVILGATTSLLINSPEKCKDNHGIFDAELIVEKIIQNEKQWFDNSKSKLSKPEMIKLINHYINMSKIMC